MYDRRAQAASSQTSNQLIHVPTFRLIAVSEIARPDLSPATAPTSAPLLTLTLTARLVVSSIAPGPSELRSAELLTNYGGNDERSVVVVIGGGVVSFQSYTSN